jgi:diguanylate cyclase (GGDEF)-like protein
MQRLQNDRLASSSRRQLFSVFVVLAVILVGVVVAGIRYWYGLSEAAFDRYYAQEFARDWELARTDAATRLWILAKLVAADDRMLPLFTAGQRDKLAVAVTPWFQVLRNNGQLTRLDFIQADRRVLLRAATPAMFGDGADSAPLRAAERSRAASSGLVVGANGVEFDLVVPVLQGGVITGFLDLGSDVDVLLRDLGTAVQADFLLLLDKSLPGFEAMPETGAPLWRPVGWDRFPDLVVAAQSRSGLVGELVPAAASSQSADRMTGAGGPWRVVPVPVADAEGRPIGRIDAIVDDGPRHRIAWIALATFLGAVLAVGGLAVVLCYLLLYRVRPALGLSNRQRQDMELVSMRDGLTGLYNRGALDALLARELAHVREVGLPLAVMIVALDEYRLFNDVKERGVGDKVALAVADSLQHQLRLGDLAVRNDGDSFILIVQRVGGLLARDVAERLRRAIAATRVETNAGLLPLSACVGVACYPESGTASGDLIGAAEQALALAKGQGRNHIRMAEA